MSLFAYNTENPNLDFEVKRLRISVSKALKEYVYALRKIIQEVYEENQELKHENEKLEHKIKIGSCCISSEIGSGDIEFWHNQAKGYRRMVKEMQKTEKESKAIITALENTICKIVANGQDSEELAQTYADERDKYYKKWMMAEAKIRVMKNGSNSLES